MVMLIQVLLLEYSQLTCNTAGKRSNFTDVAWALNSISTLTSAQNLSSSVQHQWEQGSEEVYG